MTAISEINEEARRAAMERKLDTARETLARALGFPAGGRSWQFIPSLDLLMELASQRLAWAAEVSAAKSREEQALSAAEADHIRFATAREHLVAAAASLGRVVPPRMTAVDLAQNIAEMLKELSHG